MLIKTIIAALLIGINTYALAYAGQKAELSAIDSLLAFIGTILLMIVSSFWYPTKWLTEVNSPDELEDGENKQADEPLALQRDNPAEKAHASILLCH